VRRRLLRGLMLLLLVAVGAVAIRPIRHAMLRGAGRMLMASDGIEPADLLAMDVESREAGLLALGDLYRARIGRAIGLLTPTSTAIDAELERRRVVVPDVTIEVLAQLGVPKNVIVQIPAGEGGTTESAAALAEWARAHPGKKVMVVVGPSHGRRYRRALRRVWPSGQPAPVVVTTFYGLFRAEDWWQSRTTLREGLVEMEKLALDYVAHPRW
jgi:uncharacterized SAM-binding protein YcdF (DUF218 family)